MTDQPNTVQIRTKSLEELSAFAEVQKKAGKTIALCHGVFDLLHLGHVRHLKDAASRADLLLVTITADHYVNKGPGRPIFNGEVRTEMLAALEFVNGTAIVDAPSALPAINAIKPDFYIKGMDYANAEADETGKITEERDAVEQWGGSLVFTDDVVYSSTELINRHFAIHSPEVQTALSHIRNNSGLEEAIEALDRIRDLKILLIGDSIIDEYRYVAPLGKATKDNIIATQYLRSEIYAGGVLAVANDLAALCSHVDVVTAVGEQNSHLDFIKGKLADNARLIALEEANKPTVHKTRYIETGFNRKLFEVYDYDDRPLTSTANVSTLHKYIEASSAYDLVVVADFGHGLISPDTAKLLGRSAPFLAVNTQTNAGNTGFNLATKYPVCDFLSLDGPEARLAVGNKHADFDEIITELLPAKIKCSAFMVTLGQKGCTYNHTDLGKFTMPAFATNIVDRIGAGDAVFAVTAPLVFSRIKPELVALIGNIAGATKVGIIGHESSLDYVGLSRSLKALLS